METAELLYGAVDSTYSAMSIGDKEAIDDATAPYSINSGPTILSNDSPSPMQIDGIEWATVQHYVQAEKLGAVRTPETERLWQSIRAAPTAEEAHRIGTTVSLITNWEDREVGVMAEALCAKFQPGSDAAAALLDTADRPLVNNVFSFRPTDREKTGTRDGYWATSIRDRPGSNALGRMLENCRDELQAGRAPTIDALTTKLPAWPFHVGDPAPRRAWEYADALRRHTLLRQSWTQSYRHPSAHAHNNHSTRLAALGQAIARAAKHLAANFERYGPHLAEVRLTRADLDTRERALSVETSRTVNRTQEHAMGAMQA